MTESVAPSPPPDGVHLVNLDDLESTTLVESKLGVWILEGKIIQDLVVETEQICSSPVAISKNVKVSDSDGRKITTLFGQKETAVARKAAHSASTFLEKVFGVSEGSLSGAHRNGSHIVRRHLAYEPGVDAPAHADGSGYTLLFTSAVLQVYDPFDRQAWIDMPCPSDKKQCFLILGRYFLCPCGAKVKPHAPVHRVAPADSKNGRTSVTVCINADHSWPGGSAISSTNELVLSDAIEDAERYSSTFSENHVPSVDDIWRHWTLLRAIVNGGDDIHVTESSVLDRLPSVDCTAYWRLQTDRYLDFLKMHQLYPEDALGCLPPRQIHHVWMCHMLQPLEYREDCRELLGRDLLPHDNSIFNLHGCERFHALWIKVAGYAWPSAVELAEEARKARTGSSLEASEVRRPYNPLRANFWKGYDGLEAILDSVLVDAPSVVQSRDICETTRANYARYITAASFAPNLAMAPGCAMDLVWHAHQTNPEAYQQAMDSLPCFLNHSPCGKLNPPCQKWAADTERVWQALYGRGIDLPGQSIGCCCTPMDERPKALVVKDDNVIYWFLEPLPWVPGPHLVPPLIARFDLCYTLPRISELEVIISLAGGAATSKNLHELFNDFHRDFTSVDQGRVRCLAFLDCFICLATLCIGTLILECLLSPEYHHRQREVISNFQPRFHELGIRVTLETNVIGPSPPPSHDPYEGRALAFRKL